MSKTTNLQLFKHDEPLETNENDFDIDEALNDNWDILDTFAGQVDTRLETLEDDLDKISTSLDTLETSIETIQSNVISLQTDNETNKQNIQDLQSEQETQNTAIENNTEELELLKNNLPNPVTTDQSEEITVQDAMNYYSKLDVSGNSTQEQTEQGANLWWDNDTMHFSNENRQNLTTQTIKAGTYKFSCDVSNLVLGTNTFLALYGENTYSDETSELSFGYIDNITANGRYSKEVVIPKDISTLQLKISATQATNGGSMTISNLCLRTDDSDVYVEYVPDSPSPDYPSKIKNCGDNVNFVGGALTVGYYGLSGQLTSDNLYRCFKANLKKGTYKYSYNADLYFVRQINLTTGTNLTINNNSFTLENDAEISLGFRRSDSYAWDLGETLEDLQFAIKEGTSEPEYSPYKCGSVDIKVENANMINLEEDDLNTYSYVVSNKSSNDITWVAKNGAYSWLTLKKYLKAGTYYLQRKYEIISGVDNLGQAGMLTVYTGDDKTLIKSIANNKDKDSFVITQDNYYNIHLIASNGTAQGNDITIRFYDLMLSEKDENYIEHKEKIITFPLKEGQRLRLGDYLAGDGVHHVKQTCVFDGTENVLSAYLDETIDSFRIVTSSKYNQMLSYQTDDKCSHFKNLGHTPAWGRQANTFALSSEGYLYIFFEKNKITSETEAKNWIAEQYNNGTPLTAEGTLEEEYVESYTEEQQAVYNELKNLILYKGYNYITCTDETKCKMQLTYRPDNNIKIKSLEERVAALENSEVTA